MERGKSGPLGYCCAPSAEETDRAPPAFLLKRHIRRSQMSLPPFLQFVQQPPVRRFAFATGKRYTRVYTGMNRQTTHQMTEIQKRMLQSLIFDFDGLIIDTEWTEFQAWQEMCQHYQVELALQTWLPCIGRGATSQIFDPYTYLEAQVGKTLVRHEIETWCQRRNLELIEAQPILPGVKELIGEAKARNLRLAVASSSSRHWVHGHLARLGLLACFDTLVCGDEVARTKPYPDLYLQALTTLGTSARHAVAFEDSLNGMLAARSAQLFCVVVPGRLTQYLTFGETDLRRMSLADLRLNTVEQHLLARLPAEPRKEPG